MKVNPLMTVWLISCAISYSDLTGAKRYSSFKYEKKNHEASELARLYDKGDGLASYKLDILKLLTAEKKKKNKSSDTKPTTEVRDFDACASSSTAKNKKGAKTTTQATENNDYCLSLSTTAKIKKGTKKTKSHSTKTSKESDCGDNKNSNGNDNNMINTGGGNKWKKIQKFFFFPPNWSFNKSYKMYGPTTGEAKYKEELRPVQLHQRLKDGMYDQKKFTDATYLHPIPSVTNDQFKNKQSIKEEIINKNITRGKNINSKEQMNDVDTSNNPFKQQLNEIEKFPSRKVHDGDVVSKEPIIQEEKLLSKNQEDERNTIPSMGLVDKTDERTPFMQVDKQEVILSTAGYMKQEEITLRQEISESDKMSPTGVGKLPSQDLPNEQTDTRENHHTNGVICSYENTPYNNQMESVENINYNNKDILCTDIFRTANTIGINEDIDERQLQLKPEEITDNINEKYEVSMVREDSKLSFKPEATIELEQPPNQTSMENPDLSYKRNPENMADKWKHIFNFKVPDYEQLKSLYINIINHNVTENDLITSRIENTLDNVIKSNLDSIYNIDYKNNMTDNVFLKAFGNFLKKDIPQIFPHHSLEKLYKTSLQPMLDLDKNYAFKQKPKQYFFLNTETRLPAEQIKNNSRNVQVNEENGFTLNLDTTTALMLDTTGKPTTDYLQIMGSNLLLNDYSMYEKQSKSTSTTSSSTIVKQYSIEMWPKYTEKAEYNVDYFNNLNTQSSVYPSSSALLLEESSSSNYQNELNETRATGSSSTETTDVSPKLYESTELAKETRRFETMLTIPLIFTDSDSETKIYLPATEDTTTKHMGYQSVLNLTLPPMLFNNLWGIQSCLSNSSYTSTSTILDVFNTTSMYLDDKIPFDNQHEFNTDHHFQSTTSQPFFVYSTSSEWAPLNIPNFGNEFDIIRPNTFKINEMNQENIKQKKTFIDISEPVSEISNQNEKSMIEKNKKSNFPLLQNYIPFSSEINRRNLFLLNHPLEKPEPEKKIHKHINLQKELVNDPIWNEIMYQTKLEKEKIGSSIKDFSQSEELPYGNQKYQSFRKPSFLEEKIRGDNLINFLPFPKGRVTNNVRDDVDEFFVEPFCRNLKQIELLAPSMGDRKFDKIEVIKNGIDEISTQVMNNDLKIRNKLNFWSNVNGPSSTETEELNKYEQANAEVNDEFNQNATSWPILESQRKYFSKVNRNKFDSQSIHNNEMLTEQPSASSLNANKPITSSNSWYVRNEQNEKLLASEKSFDRQLSIPSPLPVSFQKEIKFDHLTNNIGFFKNIMNQSLPEITNNSDGNKNEFSAIQMSAIKIIKKKPEMFVPPLCEPFKNIFDQNDNNTEINHEMSHMFMKMRDFANKLGMKKILLKRGITVPQNNSFESNGSWRNKCSVLQFKTDTIPFNANFTHNNKMSPSTFNGCKKWSISNIGPKKISDEWKYNMQSVIDKQNEKRNLHLNIYDKDIQKGSDRLVSNVIDNNLKHLEFQHKPLEKFSGNQIHRNLINSDYNDEQLFTNNSKGNLKRNVVGNKKMKSRELEFILDRNLPRLPLNKRQFIAYMMTGLKSSGNSIALDDERHSQLSKANLQNLIDRNVKKDKVVELANKRSKKKWHTNAFP